ncbi:MAG: helix-turn-helix domain-containing protein [Clostridiaceae bacterium]|nr:helix-turn-helix domain-containing protein [Clostridiaceae bacterium]
MTRFGEKVRDRRIELGLKQEQLADLVGVSRRTIVSYETTEAKPYTRTMRKLAEALGVTEQYLKNDDCDDPQAGIETEQYIQAARDEFGKKGADEMAAALAQNTALFAGGTLTEEQKDMYYEALSRAYFSNKRRARAKFGDKNPDGTLKHPRGGGKVQGN